MFQKGLKGIVAVQTRIASVDGEKGELYYRGQRVEELIEGRSFEELSYFLWQGRFPSEAENKKLTALLTRYRMLPFHVRALADTLPSHVSVMDGIRTMVSAYPDEEFLTMSTQEQAIALTGMLPTAIAYLYRKKNGLPPVDPDPALSHTANYLWMLTGQNPQSAQTEALETYLKLTLEHGMNASTFAARVTISTESDLTAAITSALGTMKGPLHGGAPSGVLELLEEIQTADKIRNTVEAKLRQGERIMGFGHRVYRTEDPRSIVLRKKCRELYGQDDWLNLAVDAEQEIIKLLSVYKPGRSLHTNVEFYAAAIMRSLELPPELFTPTFSAARIVGWSAHAIEQLQDNVIFRPQSEYIGS